MAAIHQVQNTSIIHNPTDESAEHCPVTKIALVALKTLGLIFMAAGVGCFIAGLQAPGISLLVMGTAALVLGFTLCKNEEINSEEIKPDTPSVIDPALVEKINTLATSILKGADHEQIQWLSKGKTRVFRHIDAPDLVFKTNPEITGRSLINGKWKNGPEQIRSRFKNICKAQEVCRVHQLGLLKIPKAQLFDITDAQGTYSVIAEESLDIASDSMQEELYRDLAEGLSQSVLQLTTFIAKTGFNDVTWRNIPILDDAPEFPGDRRIALIDLEHMESAPDGICGSWNGSVGLVGCLFSERQIDAVLEKATDQKIISQEASSELKARSIETMKIEQQRFEYYQNHDLLNNPGKPIEVDLDTLGLDLNEEGSIYKYDREHDVDIESKVSMRQVAQDVISKINHKIQKNDKSDNSVKAKRTILLRRASRALRKYTELGGQHIPVPFPIPPNMYWIQRIIDALVEKGHLFRFVKKNEYGYFVEA
ncbi:MAG TPA: hypothetical protein VHL30_01125 [Chlamydiales bacterium]|jgi:hypothetical protein|nr:hypothetical protein [Chlamydiales bacterium]